MTVSALRQDDEAVTKNDNSDNSIKIIQYILKNKVVQNVLDRNVTNEDVKHVDVNLLYNDINVVVAEDWAVVEEVVEYLEIVERINDLYRIVELSLHHGGNQAGRAASLALVRATALTVSHDAGGAATQKGQGNCASYDSALDVGIHTKDPFDM